MALAAFVLMAGCLGAPAVPQGASAISLHEARGHLAETMDGEWMLVRATMIDALDGAPDGRSPTWLLETSSDAGHQAFQISADGTVKESGIPPSQPTTGKSPESAACDIVGDSAPIAGHLALSRAWQRLDIVNATRMPNAEGPMTLQWETSCVGGQTVWEVHSPLLQNEGGTWSARAFWLDGRGLLAGFFGDPSLGHPLQVRGATPGGINVEHHMTYGAPAGSGVSQGAFQTGSAIQLAIVATVDYQGIDVPMPEGTLTAIGPSGEVYATPWVQNGPGAAMFIPEASPDDAQGNWTVRLEVESALIDVFDARFDVCTGVVFVPDSEACHALFDLQNEA